jgi:hypothetical protein
MFELEAYANGMVWQDTEHKSLKGRAVGGVDKMHLKKVITNIHAKLGLTSKMTGLFVITFFRCILSLR